MKLIILVLPFPEHWGGEQHKYHTSASPLAVRQKERQRKRDRVTDRDKETQREREKQRKTKRVMIVAVRLKVFIHLYNTLISLHTYTQGRPELRSVSYDGRIRHLASQKANTSDNNLKQSLPSC